MRVLQKNLVYVIGLAPEIADADVSALISDFETEKILRSVWQVETCCGQYRTCVQS